MISTQKKHLFAVVGFIATLLGSTLAMNLGALKIQAAPVDVSVSAVNPHSWQNVQLLRTLRGHTDWVNCVAISPDGQTLVSGSRDNTIKIWNLASGKVLATLRGHSEAIYSLAISPDGQTLVR